MTKGNKKGYMRHDTRRHHATSKITPARTTDETNKNKAAEKAAAHDIRQDADLSIHGRNDDLDEGELARLDNDKIY